MADQDEPTLTDLAADLAAEPTDVKEVAETTEPAEAESSPDENNESESTEEQEEETEADPDQEAEVESTDPEEDKTFDKAEERKNQLNTEIRDLLSTRNAIRQEVETLTAQAYRPQTPDEIMAETGQNPADARITAMEQREELREWNNRVADAQTTITMESQRILQDFSIFNPDKPEFIPEVAAQAAERLERNLIRDDNVPEVVIDPTTGQQIRTGKGIVIGAHDSPYAIYKTIADAHQASAVANQVVGQRSAEKMMANVDAPSSAVPKQPKEDPFLIGLKKGLDS